MHQQLKQQLLSGFEKWYVKKYGDLPEIAKHDEAAEAEQLTPEEDIDKDALTYIKARQLVNTIHKAKKFDKLAKAK